MIDPLARHQRVPLFFAVALYAPIVAAIWVECWVAVYQAPEIAYAGLAVLDNGAIRGLLFPLGY